MYFALPNNTHIPTDDGLGKRLDHVTISDVRKHNSNELAGLEVHVDGMPIKPIMLIPLDHR